MQKINKSDLDVLIINSYAGSLTQGAHAVGLPIRGSYEDSGFGIGIQMANFPTLEYREQRKDWPVTQDLRRTVVLAHPPCSAFSLQTPKGRTGAESDAFQCTKEVLYYGMKNNAAAIAVESVQGALAGAARVHYDYARRYGYHLYKVLQNAVSLGVPQWRPRFWAVFVKEGLAPEGMFWNVPKPVRYTTVSDVLDDFEPKEPAPAEVMKWAERKLAYLNENNPERTKLSRIHGPSNTAAAPYTLHDLPRSFTRDEITRLLAEHVGQLPKILRAQYFSDLEEQQVKEMFLPPGVFASRVPRALDPDGFAPVLLSDSVWFYKGVYVTKDQYKALMGFPPDYVFPTPYGKELRKYLSKGVCPPVATWVLRTLLDQLCGESSTWSGGGVSSAKIQPGEIANFNLKRSAINQGTDREAA